MTWPRANVNRSAAANENLSGSSRNPHKSRGGRARVEDRQCVLLGKSRCPAFGLVSLRRICLLRDRPVRYTPPGGLWLVLAWLIG